MEIQQYFNEKKDLQNLFLSFIDESDSDVGYYQNLITFIKDHKILENKSELIHFLKLLTNVANNHHRTTDFFGKIEKILLLYSNEIKQNLSNKEIFQIFVSNKILLLFLFKENILIMDEFIIIDLYQRTEPNEIRYLPYFLPEIKNRLKEVTIKNIEFDFTEFESIIEDDSYEEKRKIGENDSYICQLIRNDSIDDFISHVNRNSIPLNSRVKKSIFETNPFLNENEPSLIEYASFFGSIQIFQYLRFNQIDLQPILWAYIIHSNNAEIIHLLEECRVEPDDISYEKSFYEAIQCHHNDYANYIHDNLVVKDKNEPKNEQSFEERFLGCCFKHYNYYYFPDNFDEDFAFFYLCKYNYSNIVDLFLKSKKDEIDLALICLNNYNRVLFIFFLIRFNNCQFFEYSFSFNFFFENVSICFFFYENVSKFFCCFFKVPISEICKQYKMYVVYFYLMQQGEWIHYNFKDCEELRILAIPPNIRSLSLNSFSGCSSLTQIHIPDSVTKIDDNNFSGCTSLTNVDLPPSLFHIGQGVFSGCRLITEITVPPTIVVMRPCAFYNCDSLKKVTFEPISNILTIESSVFSGCTSLKQIIIPPSVTKISMNAFKDCTSLKHFAMYSNLTYIGTNCFQNCSSLTEIIIPDSVTEIDEGAFDECTRLTFVKLSANLTTIKKCTFKNCSALKEILIPALVTTIGYGAFDGCSLLSKLEFEDPSSLTTIEPFAFSNCTSLTQVSVPSSVQTIAETSFPNGTQIIKGNNGLFSFCSIY